MKKVTYCIILVILVLCLNGCGKNASNYAVGTEYNNGNSVSVEQSMEVEKKVDEIRNIETKEINTDNSELNNSKQATTTIKENDIESVEEQVIQKSSDDNSDEDKYVTKKFNSMNEMMIKSLNSDNVTAAKDKAKGYFITVVDFIFYDSEINGVKFNDLTEKGKETILKIVSSTDSLIMKKFPTYKEEISQSTSSAYKKASEIIKNGANNIKNFARESLGDEYYSSISGATSDLVYYSKKAVGIVGDFSGSVWTKSKETIKSWYENLKKGV